MTFTVRSHRRQKAGDPRVYFFDLCAGCHPRAARLFSVSGGRFRGMACNKIARLGMFHAPTKWGAKSKTAGGPCGAVRPRMTGSAQRPCVALKISAGKKGG